MNYLVISCSFLWKNMKMRRIFHIACRRTNILIRVDAANSNPISDHHNEDVHVRSMQRLCAMKVSCLLSTCDVSSISKSMYLKTCQDSRLTVWMPFCFTSSHHVFWLWNSSKFLAINGQRTLHRYCMILLLLGKNYFWPDDIGLITRCLSTHCSTVCKSVRPTN